jgi:hypothetical protein
MVGETSEYEEDDGKRESAAEDELYNLMRGHTSLMVTDDSSDSEDESKDQVKEDDEENLQGSSVAPESGSSSAVLEWGSTAGGGFVPNWGNHPIQDPRDQEFANEWTDKSTAYYRRSRNERMEKGFTSTKVS